MSYKIRCYTLFDIAQTNLVSRKPPIDLTDEQKKEWQTNRNSQLNFDTIIQVISLRSQPEEITGITKQNVNFKEFDNFGFLFEDEEDQPCWNFEFTISHAKVFDDGISELGMLYSDCEGVPMIRTGREWKKLPDFLDTTPELKNIYFKVISYE
jgi:hypothetical protein